MAKRKRTTRKKSKKGFFSLKILFTILLILLFTLLGFGYYLYDRGFLVFNFDKPIAKQEVKKKKDIKDIELIGKMKSMLKEKKRAINEDLAKLSTKVKKDKKTEETSTKIAIKELEKLSAKKEPKKALELSINPIETTNKSNNKNAKIEAKVFPSIDESLNSQIATEAEDFKQSIGSKEPKETTKRPKHPYKGKPKLAIIIDDVSFNFQAKKIREIPYKVTPSFLPPSVFHPDTSKLAKTFPIYMVHVPMEAIKHAHPEARTLKASESYKNLKALIKELKTQFPKAKYYNNHTGSKFTSNKNSMDRLFRVLKEENILFVDSKTTPKSKANIMAKKYKMKLLSRDTFLDNSYKPSAIKKQLKEAVKVAKRHGYAIAICHPHKSTLNVLKHAKPILKDVDLVYINELK